jgi:vancomycin resistance protein YoaR
MVEVVRILMAAKNPGSLMRRVHASRAGTQPLSLSLPVSFDASAAEEELSALKDDIDRRAVDARMDTDTKMPLAHRDGLTVDVWATAEALEAAMEAGETEVALAAIVKPARRTSDELDGVAMDAMLASFETRYDASYRSEDRSFNLAVAAEKIDGMVVLPGERFDFNEIVGERSEANGFRVATVIAAGELADGIGGGTCQISGTLHAAVFFAGLPVLERHPHSRPSSYIKLGLDAAVSYPNLNFQFENDRDYPIVIGFTVGGGIARASLWGAEHDLQVTFVRRVDETVAFREQEVEDSDLPRGVRVLSQRGIPGFELTRWRIVRDLSTRQAVRERLEDEYPPTTQIWRVGTGGSPPAGYTAPPGDQHLEYVADEYLSLTMGAGLDEPLEIRRAGRTGTYGWTEREGYPGTD